MGFHRRSDHSAALAVDTRCIVCRILDVGLLFALMAVTSAAKSNTAAKVWP